MAFLTPDKTFTTNSGVVINQYLLHDHDVDCDLPWSRLPNPILGVTIHNTPRINAASGTTQAEQHTRATRNGNMGDVIVHFYVDEVSAWQNVSFDYTTWHAADGNGPGNTKTISIEIIESDANTEEGRKAEDNGARLAAYILDMYGLGIDRLYQHATWYSKNCPVCIRPHWGEFADKVQGYLNDIQHKTADTPVDDIYRIRLSWDDPKSQIGAWRNYESAVRQCLESDDDYKVFDSNGKIVFPEPAELNANVPEGQPYRIRTEWTDAKSQVGAYRNLDSAIAFCDDITDDTKTYYVFDGDGNIVHTKEAVKRNDVSCPTLKKGSGGYSVKVLQTLLNMNGFDCGEVDGDFGDKTTNAVNNFQTSKSITVDGIVGKDTWTKLING